MASHEVRCVQFGAGGNPLREWLNTDLEPQSSEVSFLDITEPLPFADGSIDFVFSEHLIANLRHADGASHLRECFRVLKPSGRVRVATPDLQFLIDIYTHTDHSDTQSRYVQRTIAEAFPQDGFYDGAFVLNHFVRNWGHQFIYDERTLSTALQRAGFEQVRRWPVGESDDPRLQNLEHHGDAISPEFNYLQTIVLEGIKGGGGLSPREVV